MSPMRNVNTTDAIKVTSEDYPDIFRIAFNNGLMIRHRRSGKFYTVRGLYFSNVDACIVSVSTGKANYGYFPNFEPYLYPQRMYVSDIEWV